MDVKGTSQKFSWREGLSDANDQVPSPQRFAALNNPGNLALVLKASTLTVAVIALYVQDLRIIFTHALTNESTSYILIIPFLIAYLIYRKRRMLRGSMHAERKNYPESTRHFGALGGILSAR